MKPRYSADFRDLYDNFLTRIQERPEDPYIMANAPLAREYYEEIKKTEPEAFIMCVEDGPQYIATTKAAKIKIAKLLESSANKAQARAQQLRNYVELMRSEVDGV